MGENNFYRVLSALVETIHVQLSDKAVNVSVPEVFRKDGLLKKWHILDSEFLEIISPCDNVIVLPILK